MCPSAERCVKKKTVVLSQTESLLGHPCTNHLFSAAETGMHVVKMGFKVISDTDGRIRAAQGVAAGSHSQSV